MKNNVYALLEDKDWKGWGSRKKERERERERGRQHMTFMKMIRNIVLSAMRPLARAAPSFSVALLMAEWIQPVRNSMSSTAKKTEVAVRYEISWGRSVGGSAVGDV